MAFDWRTYAHEMAAKYNIDGAWFTALIRAESGWNPTALSPAGAIGYAQLMPSTAASLGVNPHDPRQNIEGGAKYLSAQLKAFGSYPLALAAYNAGPGAVTKYGGVPPYAETKAYVRRVSDYAKQERTSGAKGGRAKWSPARDAIRKKARELGVRHNGGDRTPGRNATVGGVPNSAHLTTRPEVWADDYAVSDELAAYARSLGVETIVHDAGSGMHLHVEGKSSNVAVAAASTGAGTGEDTGMVRVGALDTIGGGIVEGIVLLIGLALGAGLIFAGVTKITGTEQLASGAMAGAGNAIGGAVPG